MQRFEALPPARRTLPLRSKASARTTILNQPFVLNALATNTGSTRAFCAGGDVVTFGCTVKVFSSVDHLRTSEAIDKCFVHDAVEAAAVSFLFLHAITIQFLRELKREKKIICLAVCFSSYDVFTVNVSLVTAEILRVVLTVRRAWSEAANQKDFGGGQNSGLKEKIR
ncbi:hypothetical protein MUK42_27930 [Musa troglodytarum]|uniref:Uncharacterized protein n=1 Tax=Musa troglodytarum TaxID=320322 RepID=A0A9E7G4J7_9LILI|nr:hypothetical protein MUK42_27930 [Musa troglodytarum]